MDKIYIESSASACHTIRCCALGTLLHLSSPKLKQHSSHLETPADYEALTSLARASWLSLIEALENSTGQHEVDKFFFQAARDASQELLGLLEQFLINRQVLPWSSQSLEYMRLASATYAPLTCTGDLFDAYHAYFLKLRERLLPWLGNDDMITAVNSVIVIARHAVQAMKSRIEEPGLDFNASKAGRLDVPETMRIAPAVPRCLICGRLMEADSTGGWICPACGIIG